MGTENSRFNILWVVDHVGFGEVIHGPGHFYLNMIPEFDKNRFNIVFCVLRGKPHLSDPLIKKGFTVYNLNRGKTNFITILDLLKIVKKEDIDILHLHGYGSANFGRIVSIFTKVPNIVHAYDEDINYPFIQSVSDYLLRNVTTKAIAVSKAVKNSCIIKRNIPEDKIFILHTGISSSKFEDIPEDEYQHVKSSYKIGQNTKVVGTLARLREEKGIKYFIDAAPMVLKEYPDVVFFIAGDGPQFDELKGLVKELGVENNVIMAGFCDQPKSVLSLFDIFILASLKEGFSASIQEAMALKKAIVATEVGGTPEMLEHNDTGIMVPAGDSKSLSQAILDLLRDDKKRERLGVRACETCQKWKLNVLVKDIENLYAGLSHKGHS